MQFARFPLLIWVVVVIVAASGWVVDDYGCRTLEDDAGKCVAVNKCRTTSDLLNPGRQSDENKAILRKHACGVDDMGGLKVCCPYDQIGASRQVTMI